MPIERPLSNPGYVRPAGISYKVKTNDTWESVASAHGVSAHDLVSFNCGTTNSAEVNWYLHYKVGCVRPTHDQKNWMFSSDASPGIIYIPPKEWKRPVFHADPVDPVVPLPKPAERMNAWFGIAGKGGTMFVVVGIETVGGYVFSLDDPTKGMGITASINRLGGGFGASGGLCFIFVSGVSNPSQLNGLQQEANGFALALGPKWGAFFQEAATIKKLKPVIDVLTKAGVKTPAGLKAVLKAREVIADLINAGNSIKEALGLGPTIDPKVLMFDIPIGGGGAEVALFYGVANFNALWDNTG